MLSRKMLLTGILLLTTACNTNAGNTGTGTGSSTQGSLIVQTLSPICVDQLKTRELIPQLAKDLGITEAEVCDCGLRRTEAKFAAEPQLVVTILTDRDKQLEILSELSSECALELAQQAALKQTRPAS